MRSHPCLRWTLAGLVSLSLGLAADAPPQARAQDATAKDALRNERLAAQFDRGNRHALLVGVNAYADPQLSALRFCVNDAELLADVLVKRCGYPTANVTLVADGQPPERLPTRENIQRHLTSMLLRARAGDTVFVYFAGHGGVVAGGSVLCPTDFDPGHEGLTGVRVDHVRDLLHGCNATQKLLVLDACHSGGAKGGLTLGLSGEDLEGGPKAGGLVTFAAARRSQTSMEVADKRHGIFTYCLARALGGEADVDKNGIVDSDEAYGFVSFEVGELARKMGAVQTPVRILGEDVTGILALARVAGEAYLVKEMKAGQRTRNTLGMDLVVVMPGVLRLGSPPDEAERRDDEAPTDVLIGRPLLFGATEVTQGQYEAVMGTTPAWHRPGGSGAAKVAAVDAARLPVEQVTHEEASEFCRRLSRLPEERKAGRAYRLPTEAEWEYACRAGTTTAFSTGPLLVPAQANVDGEKPYLDAPEAPGLGSPAVVGSYPANAWGLHDLHGNVAEWCADWYGATYVDWKDRVVDPTGPASGDTRVTRGGSFLGPVGLSRSASRGQKHPGFRHRTLGFRVVCVAVGVTDR